jgi:hypothetical protein
MECRVMVGKHNRNRPWSKLEDNIEMDSGEIGWEGAEWAHLALDRNQWWTSSNLTVISTVTAVRASNLTLISSHCCESLSSLVTGVTASNLSNLQSLL